LAKAGARSRLAGWRGRPSRRAISDGVARLQSWTGFQSISDPMQDLTTGPITRHLLKTTSFMLVTMVFQTLYFLIDLYWVGRLGTEAVAAVGIAGNLTFIVLALTQMLGVGTTAVVSHAAGRKDREQALLLFNQSQVLAVVTGVLFLAVGLAARWPYASAMSADAQTAALAATYLLWFIPAMALQFALVAMGAALRAVGNFKPGMVVSTTTVIINMILAPFLIFGWGTGRPLGVAGAAISSLVAIVIGVVWLTTYFLPAESYLRFEIADWKPRFDLWRRMLAIGLPAGFEFAITALYLALVYSITRPFGAAAQAGFGIGMRIVQAGFMPVVALGFSVAPVAGQNFGARQAQRVKNTFRDAAWMAAGAMVAFAIACNIAPAALVGVFSKDPAVIAVGTEYLRIGSWGYVASGLIFVASSMFQAMGNTVPSLITSGVRIAVITFLALIVTRMPGFELRWIWYLSVGSVLIQLMLSMWLLRHEFDRRLRWEPVGG
jgi:putative MATE family efflux protein